MCFAEYAEKASALIASAPRGVTYPRGVAATFELAIGEAVARCPPAKMLMAYLAQCSPERIPTTFVEGVNDNELERRQALASLTEVSLVKNDPYEDGSPAITVHRLVQTAARSWANTAVARTAIKRMLKKLAACYPREQEAFSNPHEWVTCARLTPHLVATTASQVIDTSIERYWSDLLNRAGAYFH